MQSYEVPSMSCGHCVQAITGAIQAIDAQAEVKVNLETKRVEVNTSAAANQVLDAIDDAGFDDARALS